ESSEDEDDIVQELQTLRAAYLEADEKQRLLILSIIDPAKYTKEHLMKIFDCGRYKIDAARKYRVDFGACGDKPAEKIVRERLDQTKV
ncbi:unnamed protein product, partial [Didymodactylos carnosus]